MARGAPNLLEQALALLRGCGCRKYRVARRNPGAADELREVVDVRQAEIIRSVLWIGSDFADGGHIFGTQAVCHSHFIEISVADEGEQATVLILPAKASNTRLSGRFQHWNFDGFAMDSTSTNFDLVLRDRCRVLSLTASTNPSPKVLRAARKARSFRYRVCALEPEVSALGH
jgi:hypothetical protein